MKISYIIPVYNTNINKLNRCFESVKKSTTVEYEVIIINDGSTKTDTIDFCEMYCKKNAHRFKFFSYENSGVSAARNRGISNAEGDYIFFVDSDDQLTLSDINIDKYANFDIVLTDIVVNDGQCEKNHGFKKSGEVGEYQYIKDVLIDNYLWGPYAKFIKRKFLINNNIGFEENLINGEDAIFNLNMIMNKPRTIYVPKASYIYWKENFSSDSRMQNKFLAMVNSYIEIQKAFCSCIKNIECSSVQKRYLLKLSTDRFVINILECFIAGNSKGRENDEYNSIMSIGKNKENTEYLQALPEAR